MDEKEFKKLIKKNKHQIFIFSSPTGLPLSPAAHTWIVVSNKGKLSRWEVLFFEKYGGNKKGYLHLMHLNQQKEWEFFHI